MIPLFSLRSCERLLCLGLVLAFRPVFAVETPNAASAPVAAQAPAGSDKDAIVSSTPMTIEAEDGAVYGQLVVAPEIVSADSRADLVFTITSEPAHGRVGLSGTGDDNGALNANTSRVGYFKYRAETAYSGEDSFEYTVRNETSGLVFKNRVMISVKAPPPLVMEKYTVDSTHVRNIKAVPVTLTTRPNTPVAANVPSHENFMGPSDRIGVSNPKVAFILDDKAKPQNGTAKLDRATGQLMYAPNPGFIGEDRFKYYTIDENNSELGVENSVTVDVEPLRIRRHMTVDRSRSREVDILFVINNSPSMAGHQNQLAANLRRFRQLFDTRQLDYRIGVLTTDFIDADPQLGREQQRFYEDVRGTQVDQAGNPVLDRHGKPKQVTKRVASNGNLVTLPVLPQPWITPQTPDGIFAELVKVGTNGNDNRTAFTAVYNFVAAFSNHEHQFLRPDATTVVIFFMDEEETRMAMWKDQRSGPPVAEWIENGKLPDLIQQYNASRPKRRQTLDGYIDQWVIRPFILVEGNRRGKLEMDAVVSKSNQSHRRAAELTGGSVLDIDSDFSAPLAALGDRIADTVAVALDPAQPGATLYLKSLHVLVDGQEVPMDPQNGWIYDERTNSVRFQGAAKKKAFTAKIDITYDEHM